MTSRSSCVGGEGLLKELRAYCSPSPPGKEITEEGLKEIIHRWGSGSPNNNKLRGYFYFFFFHLLSYEQLTEGLVNTVLQYFPEAVKQRSKSKKTALHVLLMNKVVTLNMVKILVDAHPQIVEHKDVKNLTALHCLCCNPIVDATAKQEILHFLIQKNRVLMKIAVDGGAFPVHYASLHSFTPVAFMQKLIEAYPESLLKSLTLSGLTPLHVACLHGNLPMAKILVKANSNCLNVFARSRGYPINAAICGAYREKSTHPCVDLVRLLVNYSESKVAFQEYQGRLPLHLACLAASRIWRDDVQGWDRFEAHIPPDLELVKILFDAFPGAIENSILKRDMQANEHERLFHPKVMEFLNYHRVFTLPYNELREKYDPLPLHFAIMKNECLGSIKLLVDGNPAAVHIPDNNGAMPLHLAIQHHHSAEVIRFLVDKNTGETLRIADLEGNTALHRACHSARFEIIALLLDKHGAVSVSNRNLKGKLPIELLLFETDADLDRESTRYTESIFRLVSAYPAVVMGNLLGVYDANSGTGPIWMRVS